MSTEEILKLLIDERSKLEAAIAALSGGIKRRGRPPGQQNKTVASATLTVHPETAATPAKKTRTWTAAQRKAAGDRMKARFAAKKAGKK